MGGEEALQYVRQRKTLAGGDFDRVRRQQNWIRAVLKKLAARGTLANPLKLNSALDALTFRDGVRRQPSRIDQMSDIALDYQGADVSDVAFFTAPLASPSTGKEGSQSVVYLDDAPGKIPLGCRPQGQGRRLHRDLQAEGARPEGGLTRPPGPPLRGGSPRTRT